MHPSEQCPRLAASVPRCGAILIWATVILVVLIAFASLAVDLGRAQMAKTELQRAADAIALHAAGGLSQGVAAVEARVSAAAADNKVNGETLVINLANDLRFGTWDPTTRTFTTLSGSARNSATAVRIRARRTAARGTAIPTVFASMLGHNGVDVTATSIASRGLIIAPVVAADACPWLAGMPNGSQVAATGGNPQPAVAPNQSPKVVAGLPLVAGSKLHFRDVGGTTSYYNSESYGPDGNTGWIVQQAPVNGINSTSAPLNSLVGIFLDDRQPHTWTPAPALDFSTPASRDFTSFSPQLKQVFFIGDGLNSSGQLQEFVIPAGATRFYLGIMDEKGWWWDNVGTLSTTMMNSKVTLVQ